MSIFDFMGKSGASTGNQAFNAAASFGSIPNALGPYVGNYVGANLGKFADAFSGDSKQPAQQVPANSAPNPYAGIDVPPEVVSGSGAVRARQQSTTDAYLQSLQDNADITKSHNDYVTNLNSQIDTNRRNLQDDVANETGTDNAAIAARKASNTTDEGNFANKLVRIGGYLGESVSANSALLGLANDHAAELEGLAGKRDLAVQKMKDAAAAQDTELTGQMLKEVQSYNQEIADRKDKYFDAQLKLRQDAREAANQGTTEAIKNYQFYKSQAGAGALPFSDFLRTQNQFTSASQSPTLVTPQVATQLKLPNSFVGLTDYQVIGQLNNPQPPQWFHDVAVQQTGNQSADAVKKAWNAYRTSPESTAYRTSYNKTATAPKAGSTALDPAAITAALGKAGVQ